MSTSDRIKLPMCKCGKRRISINGYLTPGDYKYCWVCLMGLFDKKYRKNSEIKNKVSP